ncbi:N-glycosylase/DNA lyase [Enteropsectra breve]|nr:N-glycosylase/DNA lyase [Enteropsectra breve]
MDVTGAINKEVIAEGGSTRYINIDSVEWEKLETPEFIDLQLTLFSGQNFYFKRYAPTIYCGVLQNTPIILKQVEKEVYFAKTEGNVKEILNRFFNINVCTNLDFRYEGLRFLTNDLIPTIFSFICSSNNNVKRIGTMVSFLYSLGPKIARIGGKSCAWPESESLDAANLVKISDKVDANEPEIDNAIDLHAFPAIHLLESVEELLKLNKFGYRAKYICKTAALLSARACDFEELDCIEAQKILLELPGVGQKVCDCICLMALKRFEIVPIDVHIYNYSVEHFLKQGKNRPALNKSIYGMIQEAWRNKYGDFAGIAQLYIFKKQMEYSRALRKKKL